MSGEAFGVKEARVRIDVWSDVMCPWCYIGDTHLERALEQFPHSDQVAIEYHSFQLMPELPVDAGMSLVDVLVTKRGVPRAQAEEMNAQVTARGRDIGLDYRFDRAIATNTHRAHELSHFAKEHGRQHAVVRRLFQAYFTDGVNVGDLDALADIAQEIGLDRESAFEALSSGRYASAVDDDLAQASQIGVSGVPFFVFNMKYAVSGAQPVESFIRVLHQTWDEAE